MGAFIARQPNGLLCRFSSAVDCITDYNMTEEEYIEMCAEKAREEARDVLDHYISAFDRMLEARKKRNLESEGKKFATDDWQTGMDVFRWWMEDDNISGQLSMDDLMEDSNGTAE